MQLVGGMLDFAARLKGGPMVQEYTAYKERTVKAVQQLERAVVSARP